MTTVSPASTTRRQQRDPVCGSVDLRDDLVAEHDGEQYRFCSEICRQKFRRNPDLYVRKYESDRVDFRAACKDFWFTVIVTFLLNTLGLLGLFGYFGFVYDLSVMFKNAMNQVVGVSVATVLGYTAVFYLLRPTIKIYGSFGRWGSPDELDNRVRRNILNLPIHMTFVTVAMWILVGTILTIVVTPAEIGRGISWFFHVFLNNIFVGLVTGVGVYYFTNALSNRNLVPHAMRGVRVSELDGVIPVPVWLRITVLILTGSVSPLLFAFFLYLLGDITVPLYIYFIVVSIALTLLQGAFIIKSVSIPIGSIADQFTRFQKGEEMDPKIDIYRADDLGRFAEMYEDLVETIEDRDFIRSTFGRYMNRQLLDKILNGEIDPGGSLLNATVLFVDVRDFTSLAENSEPHEVVDFLNEYFERMVRAITNHDGIPDKFIGDGILAVWGVSGETDGHQEKAVRGAMEMILNLQEMNRQRREAGKETIQIGTGLHSGELIAGNIGSNEKMEFTVVGDTVNTCSRIEAVNKKFGTQMTISEDVFEVLPDSLRKEFQKHSQVQLPGKSERMNLYTYSGS